MDKSTVKRIVIPSKAISITLRPSVCNPASIGTDGMQTTIDASNFES